MKNRLLQFLVSIFGFGAAPALVPGPLAADLPKEPVQELVKIDRTAGTGAEAVAGKNVFVHYSGWLYTTQAADGKGKSSTARWIAAVLLTFPWAQAASLRAGTKVWPA